MAGSRISDVASNGGGVGAGARGPAARATLSGLLSPRGVMIAIPALVGAVGAFLSVVGQEAMRASTIDATHARLGEQAQLVARSIGNALAQADPLLDRMEQLARTHDPSQPFERVAHHFADLMRERDGVTYVCTSFTDGTYLEAAVGEDGVVRAQESRVQPDGTTIARFYELRGRDELVLVREDRTTYDPRERPFYQAAVRAGRRLWTEPYTFFKTFQTGVTRVAPVYKVNGEQRALHAVVTVDFDVMGLSSGLMQHQLPGTRALLFTRDGVVLAYASDGASALPHNRAEDRLLGYRDLGDPIVDALFAKLSARAPARSERPSDRNDAVIEEARAGGEVYRVGIAAASLDTELPWSLAYFVSDAVLLRQLAEYRLRSGLIAGAALLVSVVIAYLLARAITRARSEAASARADAEKARSEAKELGSYRLVERLGEGAMGAVWRAEHRLLARQAAIKLINPELLQGKATPEVRARFRREAEALASLRSRNTIELFDYGVAEDGTFFYVMELLDGLDLDALVEQHGPQPFERVQAIVIQICNSLAEAHDRGMVHRDVKPANIYICRAADEHDVVKVLDFGLVLSEGGAHPLANAPEVILPDDAPDAVVAAPEGGVALTSRTSSDGAGKLTQPGGLLGTPAFMPPEQAMGMPLDGRADLYAVACVAVWLLTGELLYPYLEMTRLILAHMREPVPDLRARLPSAVPDEAVALLTQCLQKRAEARLAGVRELATRLRAIHVEPAWTVERAQAWWDEHRPAPAAAGLRSTRGSQAAAVLRAASEGP